MRRSLTAERMHRSHTTTDLIITTRITIRPITVPVIPEARTHMAGLTAATAAVSTPADITEHDGGVIHVNQ